MSNRKKFKKRHAFVAVALPLTIALSHPPARAQLGSITRRVTQATRTYNQVRGAYSNVRGFISSAKSIFNDITNPIVWFQLGETAFALKSDAETLPDEVKDIFRNAKGEHGVIREEVQEQVVAAAENGQIAGPPLETSSNAVTALARQTDRSLTQMQAQQILSRRGQEEFKEHLENTRDRVIAVGDIADAGQYDTVTQDLVKKLLDIEAQKTMILGQSRAEALRARVDNQYTNINLANISQTLDSMHAAQRNEASAISNQLLELAASATPQ